MKNFWLDRRPKIVQMLDISDVEVYRKWYIYKPNPDANPYIGFSSKSLFLHADGVWRNTTWDSETSQYSGYYDTWEEAYNCLMKKIK